MATIDQVKEQLNAKYLFTMTPGSTRDEQLLAIARKAAKATGKQIRVRPHDEHHGETLRSCSKADVSIR